MPSPPATASVRRRGLRSWISLRRRRRGYVQQPGIGLLELSFKLKHCACICCGGRLQIGYFLQVVDEGEAEEDKIFIEPGLVCCQLGGYPWSGRAAAAGGGGSSGRSHTSSGGGRYLRSSTINRAGTRKTFVIFVLLEERAAAFGVAGKNFYVGSSTKTRT